MLNKKLIVGLIISLAAIAGFNIHSKASAPQGNTIYYFTMSRCPYCVYTSPIVNQMRAKFGNKVRIVNVGRQEGKQFGVRSYPTIMYFKNGARVMQHGSMNRGLTSAIMEQNIKRIYMA